MLFLRLVFVLAMVLCLPCWLFVVSRRGKVDHRVQHQAREQETGGGRHPVDGGRREDGQGHAEDAFTPFGLEAMSKKQSLQVAEASQQENEQK